MVLHHAFPAQKHYEHLEIKEKRRDLKIIYILAIKGRTATIIQRYFSHLKPFKEISFRQKLCNAFWERQNVFSCIPVGWFICTNNFFFNTLYCNAFTDAILVSVLFVFTLDLSLLVILTSRL